MTKNVVKEIIQLCEIMSNGRKNGPISQSTYTDKFKPYLDVFKKNNNNTPNLFLQDDLKSFYDSNSEELTDKILLKNFSFLGRTIYNYTLSCQFYDYGVEAIPVSCSPQLYIIVNRHRIKFGFYSGLYIVESDNVVTSALQPSVRKRHCRQFAT